MSFPFCQAIESLCRDICERIPLFAMIDMDRVAVSFAQARTGEPHGLQAKLTPLRFAGGSLVENKDGQLWTVQRLYRGNVEMLYILTFYLPRFQNQTFDEKLLTVFHELYHVGPEFDGDLRRFPGRYAIHTRSEKEFEARLIPEVRHYTSLPTSGRLLAFLRLSFAELREEFGDVTGVKIPIPKVIRVPE